MKNFSYKNQRNLESEKEKKALVFIKLAPP
jgi:hypothetical protein